jgi:hypothetical protein
MEAVWISHCVPTIFYEDKLLSIAKGLLEGKLLLPKLVVRFSFLGEFAVFVVAARVCGFVENSRLLTESKFYGMLC